MGTGKKQKQFYAFPMQSVNISTARIGGSKINQNELYFDNDLFEYVIPVDEINTEELSWVKSGSPFQLIFKK